MREVISASQLAPILNRDRAIIAESVEVLIQATLDSYDSGVRIVRLNLDRADPPEQVIDAFREVQAAEQERDRLERQADAYANRVLAGARGEAAQLLEEAEAYRAQVVNEAQGEAAASSPFLQEYEQAPEVTRRRLYLETMERVLGDVDLVILDGEGGAGGSGVVPVPAAQRIAPWHRCAPAGHHNDDRELELMRRITFLIPALVLAIAVLLSSIFVVDEREKGAGAAVRSDPPGDRRAGPELQDPVHPGGRLLRRPHPVARYRRDRGHAFGRPASRGRRLRALPHQRMWCSSGRRSASAACGPVRTGWNGSSTRRSGRFWVPMV
jgi:hypothetical protein